MNNSQSDFDRRRAFDFIDRVKNTLAVWGVSQSEFANAIGVYPSTVCGWFNYVHAPNEGSMIRMRNALTEINKRFGFEEAFDADQLP